jgi:glycosyltransferase involved in cell wall biosynthesis
MNNGEVELTGLPDTGGQTLFVVECLKTMGKNGITGDIITRWFDPTQPQIEPITGTNSRIVRIKAGEWGFIPKERIYGVLPELTKNLIKFVNEDETQYSLFHGHYVDGGMVALEAAKRLGVPAFFTSHSLGALKREKLANNNPNHERLEEEFNFKRRIQEELKIFQSVSAQTITYTSEADDIERLYGYRPRKTDFIPPGVDINMFNPYGRGSVNGHRFPKRYLLSYGRFAKPKGYATVAKAFLLVSDLFPDIHLVIAGGADKPNNEEAEIREELRTIIWGHKNGNRILLPGGIKPQSKTAVLCRNAEIFISGALFEPFGMVIAEAMASGVPAIVSERAGITNGLNHNQECQIVEPTAEAIAEAIRFYYENPALTRGIAFTGARAIRQYYSWEAVARNMQRFYEKHGINFN